MMYEPYRDDLINGMCFISSNLLEPTPDKPISLSMFFNTDGITVTKIQGEKGDEIMNKVLKIYYDRELNKINEKYLKKVEDEYEKIEIIKVYNKLIETFEQELENLAMDESNDNILVQNLTENLYKYDINSLKVKDMLSAKFVEEKIKEIDELEDKIAEIDALLSLSNDLSHQTNILISYNIIDKKTLKMVD